MTAAPHVVGGELHPRNPATLEPVGAVRVSPPEEIAEAVAEARSTQAAWAREGMEARRRLLRRVTRELLDATTEVSAIVTAETGKPLIESTTAEVFTSLDNADWLTRNLRGVLAPERVPMSQPYLWHKRARLLYEPVGTVAILSPWNFPFGIPFTQTATAIAAGNAVVLKPSELTPHSGALVEEVFRRAGAPPGLVRVLQGPGDAVGDRLIRQPGIDKVVFTGSTTVGRRVAARCAERLCPVTLELGGKDAMLVLDDADLERTVEGALWGAFSNCGQVCSAIERVYVARPLYEPFVARLAERVRTLRLGRGDDPSTDLGPLITEAALEKIEDLLADAAGQGAEVVIGGGRADTGLPGWFFEPTVLTGDVEGSRLSEDEIFGPAVTVVRMDNDEEGIRLANNSRFALGASVWTRDARRGRAVAARLEAGSVWMNDCSYSYGACQAPWGGLKDSGHGRTHSKHGLYGLSNIKFSDVDAGRLRPPWWYPYDAAALSGFEGALRILYSGSVRSRAAVAWDKRSELLLLARRVIGRA